MTFLCVEDVVQDLMLIGIVGIEEVRVLCRRCCTRLDATVDILIMHSVGTVKTLCIMTYMQHKMCHNIVTSVTSAKMCDSKLSTIPVSMHIMKN